MGPALPRRYKVACDALQGVGASRLIKGTREKTPQRRRMVRASRKVSTVRKQDSRRDSTTDLMRFVVRMLRRVARDDQSVRRFEFDVNAMNALCVASEEFLVDRFSRGRQRAIRYGRDTVLPSDLREE